MSKACPEAAHRPLRVAACQDYFRYGTCFTLGQCRDGVGQVGILDTIGASGHPQAVRSAEYVDNAVAFWRNELVTGHFEQLSIGISEVDRVHEPPVDVARVPDATLVEALGDLGVGGMRDGISKVMQVADAFRIGSGIIYPRGAHEESDQPSIARVEVEVGLFRDIEIGLLHNQWHPQHSLIEINGRLAVGTNECDMVNTLSLDFRHDCTSILG